MKLFYFILIFFISLPVVAENQDEYSEDRKMIRKTGHINGEKCFHATSDVFPESVTWNQKNSYLTEVLLTIWNDDRRLDIIAVIEIVLEKLGFTKTSENIYKLSDSSLCFLKLYWEDNLQEENPKESVLFVPYFKKEIDLKTEQLSQEYIPDELEKALNEELSIHGLLDESVRIYDRIWLIHYPIRIRELP